MMRYEYGDPAASAVLIQPVEEQELAGLDREIGEIRRLSDRSFSLIAVRIEDWNRELSPWAAPAVFGKEGFGGGADGTLSEILKLCADRRRAYILGGYSLAALFALWAVFQTDAFAAAAAASPSVWFPGWMEHIKSRRPLTRRVYLSLGDKEEKTRNPVMATVGDCIRETHEILKAGGADCVLEWNAGNHFKDPELRTARAFAWALNALGAQRPL